MEGFQGRGMEAARLRGDLGVYLRVIARHWVAVAVTGALPAVIGLVGLVTHRDMGLPWWGWLNVAGAAMFVASFLAWREMKCDRDRALSERDGVGAELEAVRTARGLMIGELTLATYLGEFVTASRVQIGVILKSFSQTVLEYQVESMHVVVAGKTRVDPRFDNTGGSIPPGGSTDFFFPAIADLNITEPLDGTLEMRVVYGHPDLGMSRRLTEKRNLSLLRTTGSPSVNYPRWTVLESRDDAL